MKLTCALAATLVLPACVTTKAMDMPKLVYRSDDMQPIKCAVCGTANSWKRYVCQNPDCRIQLRPFAVPAKKR